MEERKFDYEITETDKEEIALAEAMEWYDPIADVNF